MLGAFVALQTTALATTGIAALFLVVVGGAAGSAAVLIFLKARRRSRDRRLERTYVPHNVGEFPAGYLERGHTPTARGPYENWPLTRTTFWGGSPRLSDSRPSRRA